MLLTAALRKERRDNLRLNGVALYLFRVGHAGGCSPKARHHVVAVFVVLPRLKL